MQSAGLSSAFEILITRNIELDKYIVLGQPGKPRKIINRHSTIGSNMDITYADDCSISVTSSRESISGGASDPANDAIAPDATVQSGSSGATVRGNDATVTSGGSDDSAASQSAQWRSATSNALQTWNQWTAMATPIPFSLRGRRRNSMFAEVSFNLPTISEEEK